MNALVISRNKVKPYLETLAAFMLKCLSMLAVVLLPIRPIMIAVSFLVVADFVTGVWAAKKEGKPITSSGFKKTVIKTLAYQGAIVVAFILETYLIPELPMVKVVAALIGLTEGKSFFENMHRITGIDFWAEAMKRLLQATTASMDNQREEDKRQ